MLKAQCFLKLMGNMVVEIINSSASITISKCNFNGGRAFLGGGLYVHCVSNNLSSLRIINSTLILLTIKLQVAVAYSFKLMSDLAYMWTSADLHFIITQVIVGLLCTVISLILSYQ